MSKAFRSCVPLAAAAAAAALLFGGAAAQARPTYVGINYPWFAYGQSFGRGGINGQPPLYNSQTAKAAFDDMRNHHLNIVRIFIFDGLEGIYNNGAVVTPNATYLNNLTDFVNQANADGLTVYITLFNSWDFVSSAAPYSQEIFNPHLVLDSALTYNSVIPTVVNALRGKKVLYDAINESNNLAQYYSGGWQNLEGWSTVNAWIGRIKAAIRSADSTAQVTTSINNFDVFQYHTGLNTTQLDFYDLHAYNNTGAIPLTTAFFGDGKPVWTGEFGPSTDWASISNGPSLVDNFLNSAVSGGITGILSWAYASADNFQMKNTAAFNELGNVAASYGIPGGGTVLYDFEGSTNSWTGSGIAGGPWSVTEWAATGSASLKADITLASGGVYSVTNTQGGNYYGHTQLTARVRRATWGTYTGGMTAKLYVQTGSGWTWYDSGAIAIDSSTGGKTLTLNLSGVANLTQIKAVGVQFTAGSGDSGSSSVYIDSVTLN